MLGKSLFCYICWDSEVGCSCFPSQKNRWTKTLPSPSFLLFPPLSFSLPLSPAADLAETDAAGYKRGDTSAGKSFLQLKRN